MVISLSACMTPPTNSGPAAVETEVPVLPATTSPTEVVATETIPAPTDAIPSGKLPHQAGLRFYFGHVRIPIPNGRTPTEKDSTISLVPTSTTFTTPD